MHAMRRTENKGILLRDFVCHVLAYPFSEGVTRHLQQTTMFELVALSVSGGKANC